jgi:hypothetical protein
LFFFAGRATETFFRRVLSTPSPRKLRSATVRAFFERTAATDRFRDARASFLLVDFAELIEKS